MVDQQESWETTMRQLLWAVAIAALLIALLIALFIGYRYDITLWDWIKLLVVPAVIAGGGLWFNRQQRERELAIAREQREREVDIAERRTQDEALQAYLDQMSDMLIPKTDQPSLYKARPGDSLSSVARARTLTVLSRLDVERKARVVQFLYESGLISTGRTVLRLEGADLSGTYLNHADLSGADLRGAELESAYLREADLRGADLSGANLIEADLSGANLISAKLSGADLSGASLTGVYDDSGNLNRTNLSGADLSEADLSGADLRGAVLIDANLSMANLSMAKVSEDDLSEDDLSGTNLREVRGWRIEAQLREADSLEGATMPNGQKYEDWIKDKGSRKEDGENE